MAFEGLISCRPAGVHKAQCMLEGCEVEYRFYKVCVAHWNKLSGDIRMRISIAVDKKESTDALYEEALEYLSER